MTVSADNLIWIDLEMTGLNPDQERIIEIATVVTDSQLKVIAEGPVVAIYQPNDILHGMDAWCTKQHTSSGLVSRVEKSAINEAEAESRTVEFLAQYVPKGKSPMCGNSICMDRRFLFRYMPTLEKFFHYRMIDVSTIKELALRWMPRVYNGFQKDSKHVALSDIYDSIEELKYYRAHFIKAEAEGGF